MSKKQIAIIGAGISGLGCAYALRQHPEFEITLYEAAIILAVIAIQWTSLATLMDKKSPMVLIPDS